MSFCDEKSWADMDPWPAKEEPQPNIDFVALTPEKQIEIIRAAIFSACDGITEIGWIKSVETPDSQEAAAWVHLA